MTKKKTKKKEEEQSPDAFRGAMHTLADKFSNGVEQGGNILSSVAGKVMGTANDAVKAAQNYHEGIRQRGGYMAAAKRLGTDIREGIEHAANKIGENFFTDGQFDSAKAKETLKDSGRAMKEFGEKAYSTLAQMAADGAQVAETEFRKHMPDMNELSGKYEGIGNRYRGILLRRHYEECLAFVEEVRSAIPKRTMFKLQILDDAKASASGSVTDLRNYYLDKGKDTSGKGRIAVRKLATIDKYMEA